MPDFSQPPDLTHPPELTHPSVLPLGQRPRLLKKPFVSMVFDGSPTAVSGINLTRDEGDFLSLLGPCGFGKATALRMIAGLMRPTSGRILWNGTHARGDIGVVLQEPTLMPWATVARNVWLPFRLRGQGFAAVLDRIERTRTRASCRVAEDARRNRAGFCHQSQADPDGRTLCRAGRDYPTKAERRSSGAEVQDRLHGDLCHPFGL